MYGCIYWIAGHEDENHDNEYDYHHSELNSYSSNFGNRNELLVDQDAREAAET